ncbi:MAG: WD40/YVTN/BNR-like repeat-containing protein [Congregibacter sp.]
MCRLRAHLIQLCIVVSVSAVPLQARSQIAPSLIDGLEYRLVGPWRGGRVTAVTGVPENPHLYYMGAAGGGVWKTENAGASWDNISDGQIPVGTIGAVAVAPSDSNVIYIGTGEAPIRGVTTSQGEGIWKSSDAGRSFSFMGLPHAGQIAKIEVHPTDPDTAWVAVQGQIWAPNPERGVYRTRDGGVTWEQVLKVNADTGATDISLDPSNARILYAALWHHGRKPWYIKSGGEGGGIYKSSDGGDSWEKLEGGLPGLVGKIGLDVSDSQPSRIYAVLESELGQGGLWRSDDYGDTWAHINPHRVLHTRAWYYLHLTADPQDPDTVYVLNVPLMKSIDGGKTFAKMENLPHGDHQDHWINPHNSDIMINGNDGGATVTLDGGKTWSSIHNQPTAQFYRLVTDRQTPWRLYAGQQDNSTVSIAAWAWDGSIGRDDYHAVGGGESAHIAFDPDAPELIYATTINGTLTEFNEATQKKRSIVPYPERVYGEDARNLKYRSNWNPPVITSPHDRSVIYYGTQYLLKSADRGMTWEEVSPDLTRNDRERLGRNGGPLTPENVGAEFYHTIFYIVESEVAQGTIWVGADDGLLHLTRNGGEDWQDISPPHRGEAMINAIELSPHSEGTAYLAVTAYKLDDFDPYIYRTRDHGKRWERIDAGLPDGAFVRVVREDPTVPGLLYAGTEKGLFVSWNAGADWQSADLNLPSVPITDLRVREDALAVATQGRAFWVLDDLFVLRQAAQIDAQTPLHVYTPSALPMGRTSAKGNSFEGKNPSPNLPIYYHLDEEFTEGLSQGVPGEDATLSIDILDSKGDVLRHYSTVESDHDRCRVAGMDPRRPFTLEYPSFEAGLQRWEWDLRADDLPCVDGHTLFEGYKGPIVAPGIYTARVMAGSTSVSTAIEVLPDPRAPASDEEIAAWVSMQNDIAATLEDVLAALGGARAAREQVHALQSEYNDADLKALANAAVSAIDDWESSITELRHETFEDEDAWVMKLDGQLRHLLDIVGSGGAPVTGGARERHADLNAQWAVHRATLSRLTAGELEAINRWAKQQSVPHVQAPMP